MKNVINNIKERYNYTQDNQIQLYEKNLKINDLSPKWKEHKSSSPIYLVVKWKHFNKMQTSTLWGSLSFSNMYVRERGEFLNMIPFMIQIRLVRFKGRSGLILNLDCKEEYNIRKCTLLDP